MGDKIPVSTLVLVYTPDLRVLLLERADYPEHWQSVTGSQEPGETLAQTATRELREETGIDAGTLRRRRRLAHVERLRDLSALARIAIRPERRTIPSTCSRSRCRSRCR